MCLAVPSQVITIKESKAEVEIGGVTRTIDISLIPDVTVGDYVLVHTGYAITVIDADEARETIKLLEAIMDD